MKLVMIKIIFEVLLVPNKRIQVNYVIWWCSIVDELHPISNETVTQLRWRRLL